MLAVIHERGQLECQDFRLGLELLSLAPVNNPAAAHVVSMSRPVLLLGVEPQGDEIFHLKRAHAFVLRGVLSFALEELVEYVDSVNLTLFAGGGLPCAE